MASTLLSPGVEIQERDLTIGSIETVEVNVGAIAGAFLKGPVLTPTVVSSYGEYVQKFGELIESGSDKYQYLTSHTAKEYLRQGGPLTVIRVGTPNLTRATATVNKDGDLIPGGIASGSLTIVGDFGQVVGDETQITVVGNEFKFRATDDESSIASDGDQSPLFFHETGSSTANYIDKLVAEINAASIGVSPGSSLPLGTSYKPLLCFWNFFNATKPKIFG